MHHTDDDQLPPPSSPSGWVHVNNVGDVSLTLTFPGEVTAWGHLSAKVEFKPQGPPRHSKYTTSHYLLDCVWKMSLYTLQILLRIRICHLSLSLHHCVPSLQPSMQSLQITDSPVIQSNAAQTHDTAQQSPYTRSHHDNSPLSYISDLPSQCCHIPSSPSAAHTLQHVKDLANYKITEANGDEPKIICNTFKLSDIPDPVWPKVGGVCGPKEPLPFSLHYPLQYYVVIKGSKIGIFLEEW